MCYCYVTEFHTHGFAVKEGRYLCRTLRRFLLRYFRLHSRAVFNAFFGGLCPGLRSGCCWDGGGGAEVPSPAVQTLKLFQRLGENLDEPGTQAQGQSQGGGPVTCLL